MYCKNCGNKIKEGSNKCDKCGLEVSKMKHMDNKVSNPYVSACLVVTVIAFILVTFPWNVIGEGIGTSLPMRIIVTVTGLLAVYHGIKAKQVNNCIFSKYKIQYKKKQVAICNAFALIISIMGVFSLLTYNF